MSPGKDVMLGKEVLWFRSLDTQAVALRPRKNVGRGTRTPGRGAAGGDRGGEARIRE